MEAALSSAAVEVLARSPKGRSALSPLAAAEGTPAQSLDEAWQELETEGLAAEGRLTEVGHDLLGVLADPDIQLTTLAMTQEVFLAGRYYGQGRDDEFRLTAFTPMPDEDAVRVRFPLSVEEILARLLTILALGDDERPLEWQLRVPLPTGLAVLGAADVLRRRALRQALGGFDEGDAPLIATEEVEAAFDRASEPNPTQDILSLVSHSLGIVPSEWRQELPAALNALVDSGELVGDESYQPSARLVDLALRYRLDIGALGIRLTHREGRTPQLERYAIISAQAPPSLLVELIAFDEGIAGLNLMLLTRRHLTETLGNIIFTMAYDEALPEPPPTEPVPAAPPELACAQCGAALERGQGFCEECGATVEEPRAEAPKEQFCTNCGQPMDIDSTFCAECGAEVS